jgi:unsaturated rhamnogalacturonyl hydrolase
MEYESRFNENKNMSDIASQFENARRLMYDDCKRLYKHGYDDVRIQFWADKETGLSKSFWLRSIGWHLMALIDTIEVTDKAIYEHYRLLCDLLKEGIQGILDYQEPQTRLFWQVVDMPELEGNYLETSGGLMIAYAIMKGVRLGVLNGDKYLGEGRRIFDSILELKLKGKLLDICKSAGLGPDSNRRRDGTPMYYINEDKADDDPKGAGAFMMAFAERLKTNGL